MPNSARSYYSIVETAKANGIKPYAYLALVLKDMQFMGKPFPNEEFESFMPWSEELMVSISNPPSNKDFCTK